MSIIYPLRFFQSQMEGTVNFSILVESVWKQVLGFWCSPKVPENPVAPTKRIFLYISGPQCVLSGCLCAHAQPTSFISFQALWQKPVLSLHNPQHIPNLFLLLGLYLWCPFSARYASYRALRPIVLDCFALTSCTSVLKGERALCQVELGLNHRMAIYLLCDISRIT